MPQPHKHHSNKNCKIKHSCNTCLFHRTTKYASEPCLSCKGNKLLSGGNKCRWKPSSSHVTAADYYRLWDECPNCTHIFWTNNEIKENQDLLHSRGLIYVCLTCPDKPQQIRDVRDEMLGFRAFTYWDEENNKCPTCETISPNYLNKEVITCFKCGAHFSVKTGNLSNPPWEPQKSNTCPLTNCGGKTCSDRGKCGRYRPRGLLFRRS